MQAKFRPLLLSLVILALLSSVVLAEDGTLFRRNISKTPDAETEQAALFMMDFYVPAQKSTGEVAPIVYPLLEDGVTVAYENRYYAKPLVAAYIDDVGTHAGEVATGDTFIQGAVAIGAFDAFIAVSLDDGNSWKTTNISNASHLSSFTLANGTPYPGDAHHVVHQVFDDNIFVAWATRYCDGGHPLYTLKLNNANDVAYLTDLETNYGKDALYLYDLFGVGGTQRSVDYTAQGFPEVGEIPYSCIWTARGKLLAGDDPATADFVEASYVMWTKPERVTSGTRDANLPQVDCAAGAGCALIWQEDPNGLRPGLGVGPGEGWSGAVSNGQTDLWYTYIRQEDFDIVFSADNDTETEMTMAEYALLPDATMPKPYVPMAMPIRLTDNAMCKYVNDNDPYCYINFDNIGNYNHTNIAELQALKAPQQGATFCTEMVEWTNPGGTTLQICKTQDGRVLNGRVGATRNRINTKGYDSDRDGVNDRAWVIAGAEETKALGDLLVDPYGVPTEDTPLDIGKNMFYYTFDLFSPPILEQGMMVNQPAVCSPWVPSPAYECTPYELFPVQIHPLNGGEFYLTDITRRFSLTTNAVSTIANSESGLSAILFVKNGIINQGGPADIFIRRFVQDVDTFDPAVDNPFDYANMECDEWKYTDDSNGGHNPNYLHGLCMSNPINASGTTIVRCENATGNDACAALFPSYDDGSTITPDTRFEKVLEWRNCDGVTEIDGCEPGESDLDDYVWENPYDVAKGHRGFLDGDIVMIMYAWSPNWHANAVGNDHYNLYIRRSFDGGLTWTTTPAELGGEGSTSIENYCVMTPASECEGTEWVYGPGEFEQAVNVSQLIGNKVTILDPRYTPTGGLKLYPTIRTFWLENNADKLPTNLPAWEDVLPYPDDAVRDRSKFFVIYETGDNTTVTVGEATPLDLFYSRATNYGDVWELDPDWVDPVTGEIIEYRWPWAEHDKDDLSGEAAMLANPGGTFMYAVWNQWKEDILPDGEEHIYDSDIIFRRFMYLPDDSSVEVAPVAKILYVNRTLLSIATGDELLIMGTARPFGNASIEAYEWKMKPEGASDEDAIVVSENRMLQLTAAELVQIANGQPGWAGKPGWTNVPDRPGWVQFQFRARDSNGNWSNSLLVNVGIAMQWHRLYIPSMIKN